MVAAEWNLRCSTGITGSPQATSAGSHHPTATLAGGQLVLVVTDEGLASACDPPGLLALLRRRMLDLVKGQVLEIGPTSQRAGRRNPLKRPGTTKRRPRLRS